MMRKGLRVLLVWLLAAMLAFGALAEGDGSVAGDGAADG